MDYEEYLEAFYYSEGNELQDYEDYTQLTAEQETTLKELEERRNDRDTRVFWQQYEQQYGNTWDS